MYCNTYVTITIEQVLPASRLNMRILFRFPELRARYSFTLPEKLWELVSVKKRISNVNYGMQRTGLCRN